MTLSSCTMTTKCSQRKRYGGQISTRLSLSACLEPSDTFCKRLILDARMILTFHTSGRIRSSPLNFDSFRCANLSPHCATQAERSGLGHKNRFKERERMNKCERCFFFSTFVICRCGSKCMFFQAEQRRQENWLLDTKGLESSQTRNIATYAQINI